MVALIDPSQFCGFFEHPPPQIFCRFFTSSPDDINVRLIIGSQVAILINERAGTDSHDFAVHNQRGITAAQMNTVKSNIDIDFFIINSPPYLLKCCRR